MRERREAKSIKLKENSVSRWIKWVLGLLLALGITGLVYRDYQRSQVVGSPYRYNMVLTGEEGNVSFVTFDPEEKQIFAISYPPNLEIKSRSVGTYRIENLYQLGSYEGGAGAFVRRKVQGFMRVPVAGYIEAPNGPQALRQSLKMGIVRAIWKQQSSSLSRLDSLLLLSRLNTYDWREVSEEELVRAGVITKNEADWQYNHGRLKQYLGARIFDWKVGSTGVTVAVLNATEVDGLGADVAEFLSIMGFDVVAVKGAPTGEKREKTSIVYAELAAPDSQNILQLFESLFGWTEINQGTTEEYRANLVITLGVDAAQLF